MGVKLRITARIDEDAQGLLTQAAALLGMKSMNAFIVSAAIEKAQKVIKEQERLLLTHQEAQQLFDALDCEAKSHNKLHKAFKKYKR